MKVQRKRYEINPATFEIDIYYDDIDVKFDFFTGEGQEEIDKIKKQNDMTNLSLSNFLQEDIEKKGFNCWAVIEHKSVKNA